MSRGEILTTWPHLPTRVQVRRCGTRGHGVGLGAGGQLVGSTRDAHCAARQEPHRIRKKESRPHSLRTAHTYTEHLRTIRGEWPQ